MATKISKAYSKAAADAYLVKRQQDYSESKEWLSYRKFKWEQIQKIKKCITLTKDKKARSSLARVISAHAHELYKRQREMANLDDAMGRAKAKKVYINALSDIENIEKERGRLSPEPLLDKKGNN